jgi:hypothetical protein
MASCAASGLPSFSEFVQFHQLAESFFNAELQIFSKQRAIDAFLVKVNHIEDRFRALLLIDASRPAET